MVSAPASRQPVIVEAYAAGWLKVRPDGRFIWWARSFAKMEGFCGQRELGRDETKARRLAAEEDQRIATYIAKNGRIQPANYVCDPKHPATLGAPVAEEGPDGRWTVRRGAEVLLAGARRFEALALIRERGGLVSEIAR